MSGGNQPDPKPRYITKIDGLWGRAALMLAGFGVLMCGVIAAFRNLDSVAVAALLATGFAILFIGFYAGYITNFKFGQLEAVISNGVTQIQAKTEDAVKQVQTTAQSASESLRQAASEFESLRKGMARGVARDDRESEVLESVMLAAIAEPPNIEDIRRLVRSSELNDRISALGALRVHPDLWDFDCVLYAIEHYIGGFDLDRYLCLSADMLHKMKFEERKKLRSTVEQMRDKRRIKPDQIRWLTSERLILLMDR